MGTVSLALVRRNVPGDDGAKTRSYSGKFTQVLAVVPEEGGHRAVDSITKGAKFHNIEVSFKESHSQLFIAEAQITRMDGVRKGLSSYLPSCHHPPSIIQSY